MYIDVCLFVYLKLNFLCVIDDLVWVILFLFLFVLKKMFFVWKNGWWIKLFIKNLFRDLEEKKLFFVNNCIFFKYFYKIFDFCIF